MHDHNLQNYMNELKPLVDTGRKPLPLMKYPEGLDFCKTIGSTTYIVTSHFKPDASECLIKKVSRLLDSDSK